MAHCPAVMRCVYDLGPNILLSDVASGPLVLTWCDSAGSDKEAGLSREISPSTEHGAVEAAFRRITAGLAHAPTTPGTLTDQVLDGLVEQEISARPSLCAVLTCGQAAASICPGNAAGRGALAQIETGTDPMAAQAVSLLVQAHSSGPALARPQRWSAAIAAPEAQALAGSGTAASVGLAGVVAMGAGEPGRAERCARDLAAPLVFMPPTDQNSISEAEQVWDLLGISARAAQSARQNRTLNSAVLALRGRGRVIGALNGESLIRFGVSEWR